MVVWKGMSVSELNGITQRSLCIIQHSQMNLREVNITKETSYLEHRVIASDIISIDVKIM